MPRYLLFYLLLLSTSFGWSARAQSDAAGLPARPTPFRFVTDDAQLLRPADAKTLENGLRRYADNTGTQIVVVTVPTLGSRSAADYGRALGTAWGVGQRNQNNGVVVLVAKQERAVTIQAGSGLRTQLTPAVTERVIDQEMTPRFKQGNYFAGLKAGLNTLMLAANPSSDPRQNQPSSAAPAPPDAPAAAPSPAPSEQLSAPAAPELAAPPVTAPQPEASGFGLGTLVLGVVVLGGGLWLVSKLFRRNSANAPVGRAPDFLPNQPTTPNNPGSSYRGGYGQPQAPDFLPNRSNAPSSGSGMGGVLLTGAAAAAGAYLGNRMANGADEQNAPAHLNPDLPPPRPLDTDAAAGAGSAGGGFPFLGNDTPTEEAGPDYFADDTKPDSGPDYFTNDDSLSSYDNPSSDDAGGGNFDDPNDNTGTW